MTQYTHLFFDLDRTLWDFESNSHAALELLYQEHELAGRGIESFVEFLSTYREINEWCWARYRTGTMTKEQLRRERFLNTFRKFGVDDEDLSLRFGDGYIAESPRQKSLLPGAKEALDYLAGKYQLHIITNGFKEVQFIKLENCGLTQYFSEVVISEEVGEKKPHRMVFDHALRLAKASRKESVMVGDDLAVDVIGAREAGWDQIYYNPHQVGHTENVTFEIQHLNELKNFL